MSLHGPCTHLTKLRSLNNDFMTESSEQKLLVLMWSDSTVVFFVEINSSTFKLLHLV